MAEAKKVYDSSPSMNPRDLAMRMGSAYFYGIDLMPAAIQFENYMRSSDPGASALTRDVISAAQQGKMTAAVKRIADDEGFQRYTRGASRK